jgi:hypothetical protein
VSVSFSTSATATFVWQVVPAFDLVLPIRMLYVANEGWNPVVEFGGLVNLSKVSPSKVTPLTVVEPTEKQKRDAFRRAGLEYRGDVWIVR